MTWPSRICFSGWLLLLVASAGAQAPVRGRVELSDGSDSAMRRAKADFAGVVVWLTPADKGVTFAEPRKHAVMLQKDKRFLPHVLAVQRGTTIDFPNNDLIFHNAFSNFDGKIFDIGLYPPGTSRAVKFDRAGVVRVFCNIHAAMSAVIVVVDTPYYARSESDGTWLIRNVPAGEYRIHYFHERAESKTLNELEQTVRVSADGATVSTATITETAYLPSVHKNKYGQDYPANKVAPGYGDK